MEDATQSRLRGMFTRRNTVIGTVGVAGIVGGLVAGAGMFASAATAPTYNSELSQCAAPAAVAPSQPVYKRTFTAGGSRVSGTIPALTTAQLTTLGITPTLVNVAVTTQYNSGRSGANKTDIATVNLPGHQYTNPLLFNIPPVTNSEAVGTGTVNYAVKTTGKAVASVTITETIASATSLTPELVAGATCPVGPTGVALAKVGSLSGQTFQAPAAPTNVAVTAGGTAPANSTDAAPNNGAVTVKFTPSVNNGTQPALYEVFANDTTNPSKSGIFGGAIAPSDANSTAQLTANVSGLNTNDAYTFQVFAVSTQDASGAASIATTPALKPAVETVAAPGSTQASQLKTYQDKVASISGK